MIIMIRKQSNVQKKLKQIHKNKDQWKVTGNFEISFL